MRRGASYDLRNGGHVLAIDGRGKLYASVPPQSGSAPVAYVAMREGAGWRVLGNGMNSEVSALAIGPDDSVYAAVSNQILRWDSATPSWRSMGSGVSGDYGVAYVFTLAFGPDGLLYAGGYFTAAGGVRANNIAKWDPSTSTWSALGSGIAGGGVSVYALAFGLDGSLYVGGDLTTAGGVPANNIAKWDPSTASWSALGNGTDGSVWALAVDDDGDLYAGGCSQSPSGMARLRRGTPWQRN